MHNILCKLKKYKNPLLSQWLLLIHTRQKTKFKSATTVKLLQEFIRGT